VHIKLRRGDLVLLCSDGLYDHYPAANEIAALLGKRKGREGLARLVELAKERGGRDNVTGVLVEVGNKQPRQGRLNGRGGTAASARQRCSCLPTADGLQPCACLRRRHWP